MVYYALAQSLIKYCVTIWGGSVKTQMLRVERSQRCILKVMALMPRRFPTTEVYSFWDVLTVRQLFILNTIVRKHATLRYNPVLSLKRRSDRVCNIEPYKSVFALRCFRYMSPMLYNKVNKTLNIFPMTVSACNRSVTKWLKSLSYDETESLLKISV